MKLTLTKVYRSTTDKQGKPLVTRQGKPYEKIAVQAQEYGTRWLSGFAGQWNAGWREGDAVEVDVETNGEFLNLRRPDPLKKLEQRVEVLETQMKNLFNPELSTRIPTSINKTDDAPF